MFFQAPPRVAWPRSRLEQDSSNSSSAQADDVTAKQAADPTPNRQQDKSDTNGRVYIQSPSNGDRQAEPAGSGSTNRQANSSGQGHKRGTIIASASTRRGPGVGRSYSALSPASTRSIAQSQSSSSAAQSLSSSLSSIFANPNQFAPFKTRSPSGTTLSQLFGAYLARFLLYILPSLLIQFYCIHLNHVVTIHSS